MGLLIDTSVLIAAERGTLDLSGRLDRHGDQDALLPAIVVAELFFGVFRAPTAVLRARRERYINALLSWLPVVPFDVPCARAHAMLAADLRARGLEVGAHDLIIAATAVATASSIATRDLRSFPRIPDLDVQQW
jgi:predicted nucleic acid-binding protein